jgi:hypothetical protein
MPAKTRATYRTCVSLSAKKKTFWPNLFFLLKHAFFEKKKATQKKRGETVCKNHKKPQFDETRLFFDFRHFGGGVVAGLFFRPNLAV